MSIGTGRDGDGVTDDPTGATVELGEVGMDFLVDAAMTQIKELMADQ